MKSEKTIGIIAEYLGLAIRKLIIAIITAGILQLVWNNVLIGNMTNFKVINFTDCFTLAIIGVAFVTIIKRGNKCDN